MVRGVKCLQARGEGMEGQVEARVKVSMGEMVGLREWVEQHFHTQQFCGHCFS